MNKLPTKKRIFSDLTCVSRGLATQLANKGVTDKDSVVISWPLLNPFLRDNMLSEEEAKALILLETYRDDGKPIRLDTINRLVNYLVKIDKVEVRKKIKKAIGI